MLFGEKTGFAIDAVFEAIDGPWCFGHLRFWITGTPVGDFEQTSDLTGSARWGRDFLAASAKRTRADLDATDAEDLYHTLYGRFFERGGSRPEEAFDRDPFVLDEMGESSLRDHCSILVVRRWDASDRVVVRDHKAGKTWEAVVAPGACDSAIDAYCSWVEALHRQAAP